ncbi:DNA-nicking Smr family endonuclease [Microvirga flocculans]|uniref:DNA-nicking Smr family endonuclease n=1 Tax=Microvirga flocculans TaxID=217168 RepID=A0A7W6ICJ0_9HYPH|nr:Smr/MutS family protein [Microvirga flocculans]MBB4038904.1 DNA-nicking Smr family endonuclease [Microvirga flocculans]
MSKRSRTRQLSPDEKRLWSHVARHVKPMKGKGLPPEPEPEEKTATAPVPQIAAPAPVLSPLPPPKPALPPLAPVERKTLQALRRGRKEVDSVIDLHGMRQEEAHFALLRFLHRAQGSGYGLVLVITGKGGASVGAGPFEERGVLRRMVPHWLRLPDLRHVVIGFEEASPQHGGSGALYVRLRRRRGGERTG